MADHLNDLLAAMEPDPWRRDHAFSSEVGVATRDLLSAQSDEERSRTLSQWLQKYQPCLFGRLAAKRALLTYCFLTEADFANGDQFVRDKIQSARLDWTRAGYEGRNSGFVLLVVSERLASALPNAALRMSACTTSHPGPSARRARSTSRALSSMPRIDSGQGAGGQFRGQIPRS